MVKTFIPYQLLVEWFIKSLLPCITEDVAKVRVVTEEEVIARVQYLDLIYTQSNMLYDKIPNAPRPQHNVPPPPTKESHVADGVVGSTSQQKVSKISGSSPTMSTQNSTSATPAITSKSNVVQSTKDKYHQLRKKKKDNYS